jgi:hypothetical protein
MAEEKFNVWEFKVIGFGSRESHELKLWSDSGKATYVTMSLFPLPEVGSFQMQGYMETKRHYSHSLLQAVLPFAWQWTPVRTYRPNEICDRIQTGLCFWERGRRADWEEC